MAHRGFLTAGDLLYEGSDYDAWRRKTEAMVVMHYHQGDDQDIYDYDRFANCLDGDDGEDDRELAAAIHKSVFKGLLIRVPDKIRNRPFQLVDHLEGLAKPFRFLDLGDDIRKRVYKFLFNGTRHDIYNNINPGRAEKDRMPPLLQVSSKLRLDASLIFYQTTQFVCGIRQGEDLEHDIKQIKTWATMIAADSGRRMQYLYLFRERAVGIQFHYTVLYGLMFGGASNLSAAQGRVLTKHVKATEAFRKGAYLHGESLITTVTVSHRLWEKLNSMQ